MTMTSEQARKVRDKNYQRDPNFYANIGRKGGVKSRGGGFHSMTREQRIEAGRKGGINKAKNRAEALRRGNE